MEKRTTFRSKLVIYFCFLCVSFVVIIFGLTLISNGSNQRERCNPVEETLRQHLYTHGKQTTDTLTSNSTRSPKLRTSLSQPLPPMYNILIVSIDDWRANVNTLPRTVRCEGFQSLVLLEKVNISNLSNFKHADYLIFTGDIGSDDVWLQLQRYREKRQLWVFSTAESAFTHGKAIPPRRINYIRFNITSTFHPNAHIQVPYGRIVGWDSHDMKDFMTGFVSNLYHQKQKLAVWVSSHCNTRMWKRLKFVHDLAKLIPVDMYGECGQLSCPLNENCLGIFGKYKFAMAFENSCCGGYITEKFWNALGKYHAIPVVIGAKKSDYLQQVPPKSFIHVDDFESMQDLAKYILEVAKNKTLYDDYIKWKVHGYVRQTPVHNIFTDSDAGVCRLLNYNKSHSGNITTFDPYGPKWLGGCFQCGKHSWIKNYSNWQK